MKTIIFLCALLTSMGRGIAGAPEQDVKLPESPPFAYFDWTWGKSSARQLDSKTAQEIRSLLSKRLKKLPKPFSPYGPGGLAVSPERVVQIRDAKGTDHAQILLMHGLIVYDGEYATTDKDVIAKFLKLLPPAKAAKGGSPRQTNG